MIRRQRAQACRNIGCVCTCRVHGAGMHRLSACFRQLDTPRTRGRASFSSLPYKGSVRTDCPHQANTLQSCSSGARWSTKSLESGGVSPSPTRASPSAPDLTTTRRSGPRVSCGRGSCAAFVALRAARPSHQSRPVLGA